MIPSFNVYRPYRKVTVHGAMLDTLLNNERDVEIGHPTNSV